MLGLIWKKQHVQFLVINNVNDIKCSCHISMFKKQSLQKLQILCKSLNPPLVMVFMGFILYVPILKILLMTFSM